MKKYFLKSFALLAMLFSAITMSAVSYCGEQVQSTIDNKSVSIGVTILKVGDALRVSFDSEYISGIRNGGTFQQWGNGVWANEADAVANFKEGWTQSGTTWTKDFTFSTYPTSGVGKIYCLFNIVNAGNPPVAGFTLTDIDLFNASCDSSGEGGGEDIESPVMTSATVESYTHNSAVIAVEAEDNIGVVKYHIVDANNGIDEMLTATAGKITLANLSSATTYNLTISAIDKVGNESTGRTVTAFTTDALLYCDFPTGHESNAAFGDVNGRILVSAIKVTPKKIRLLIKSAAEATKNIDLVYVAPVGAAAVTVGSDVAEGGSREVAVDIEYATAPATYGFMIQWSNPAWTGRWQASINNILPSQLCTEPVEVYDVNFALTANGSSATASSNPERASAAIDGNEGTSWESIHGVDPQNWILDLGQARIFNTIEIVWETACAKDFTISTRLSESEEWNEVLRIEDQTAGQRETKTHKIDKTTARFIKFEGTERATQWGYSFWEFRVYLAGVSTFTSLEAKPATNLSKVGEGNAITLTAKDQNGQLIATPDGVTYTITPADAGTITNNIYTPARIGLASIVATIGEVSAPAFEVFAYDGENVALSPDINNSKIVAQSDFAPSGTDAWHAIDGNEGSEWQGSATNGTAGDEAARTYDSWFVVDFGAEYDVNLVSIKFEGACSQEYHVDFSADNATWNVAYNHVGNAGINAHTKLIYGNDLQNSTKVRYARFYSTKAATQYGMKIHEFKVFGTESASLTKAVSASVNDAAMGTATVTQEGIPVTEVATGSQVTFTAIANEGYTFVNWSDGNTNPSFTTTVDAAMHLTANFRALGNIYCNTPMTVDGHTIYVTMKRTAPENYELIVRSEENLKNFGGTVFYMPTDTLVVDLRNEGVLSDDKHTLTGTFTAERVPYMTTPLYVIFEGIGEKTYQQLSNIEYDVECEEDMTVTGLALDPASVSIMVGGSQTLKPLFTPAHAFTNELVWSSSDETIITVDTNGVVTAVAEGEAIITATLVSNEDISATCNVTITPFVAYTFYGQDSDNNVDFAYNLTNNANGTVTIVADVLTSNPGLGNISFSIDNEWKNMTKNADGTYTRTSEKAFSMGQEVACFLYAEYTGGAGRIDFKYIVGSSNERPTAVVESVTLDRTTCDLTPNESVQLLATVNPGYATNKSVTWSSSDNNVATVDANGLVTAKSAGTAIITVTTTDGGKTATCTINVIATLTDVTYHASTYVKKDAAAYLGINYSITRTSDRTLRYVIKVNNSEYVDLEFNVVVNDNWQRMTYDASTNTYTYTTITTYADGDGVSGFFRQIKYGVEGRWDFNYVVGSTSTTPRTMVAFNDEDVDLSHLNNGSVYDVILKRNLVMDDDWNTLCLPFALTEEQVVDIFGEGTTLVKLQESKLLSATEIELEFVPVTYIEASTPYLIKPAQNVGAGVALEGVVINLTPNVIETDDANMIPVLKAQSFTGENNTFYLGANENLYPRPTSREIKAMRAYFQFPNLTAAQASKLRARVVVEENVETALDNVSGQKQENIKVISNGQLIIIRDGVKYNAQGVKISE